MLKQPFLLEFQQTGSSKIGFISIAEIDAQVSFKIQRVYWTYSTPPDITRGHHSHKLLEQVLIAAAGKITVDTELPDGTTHKFILDHPNTGLFLPTKCWRTLRFSKGAVLLVLASRKYKASEYLRDYSKFRKLK